MYARFMPLFIIAALACFTGAVNCHAADSPKAQTVTITGIVKPAAQTAEEAATVKVGESVYRLVKDTKGKIVARDAAGRKAEIRGTVEQRDGAAWIKVSWCALVE